MEFLLEVLQEETEEMGEVCISALLKMKIRSSTTSTKRSLKQKPENQGRTKDQYGAHGSNLELVVPVGTMIKDTETGKFLLRWSTTDKNRDPFRR